MKTPKPPALKTLNQITPSIYEQATRCKARAAWAAFGARGAVPEHPAALLGSCFHHVLARASGGALGVDADAALSAARSLFDTEARARLEAAHPLVRAKFRTAERLPYFFLLRERAAALAASGVRRSPSPERTAQGAGRRSTEVSMASRDGLIAGRADRIDANAGEITDFKTRARATPQAEISESDLRQLRLYAHLAHENGLQIRKGAIVYSDGSRKEIALRDSEASAEGESARAALREFNASANAGAAFYDVASPSASNCQFCPCIPFCERFWEKCLPEWSDELGQHVQGTVVGCESASVQGTKLVTLRLQADRGTGARGEVTVEQVPQHWFVGQDTRVPEQGEVIRVVSARTARDDASVLRVDRTATAIWETSADG
jgi:hypothetical protein